MEDHEGESSCSIEDSLRVCRLQECWRTMSQRFEVDVWAATAVGEATNVVDLAALGVNLCDGFKVFGIGGRNSEGGTRKIDRGGGKKRLPRTLS